MGVLSGGRAVGGGNDPLAKDKSSIVSPITLTVIATPGGRRFQENLGDEIVARG